MFCFVRLLSYDRAWQSHYCISKQSYIRVFGCQEEKHTQTTAKVESCSTGLSANMLSYSYTNDNDKLLSDPVFGIAHSLCFSKTETNTEKYEHYHWIVPANTEHSVKDAQF